MLSGNHFVILYLQKNLCNSFAGVEILLRFALTSFSAVFRQKMTDRIAQSVIVSC